MSGRVAQFPDRSAEAVKKRLASTLRKMGRCIVASELILGATARLNEENRKVSAEHEPDYEEAAALLEQAVRVLRSQEFSLAPHIPPESCPPSSD